MIVFDQMCSFAQAVNAQLAIVFLHFSFGKRWSLTSFHGNWSMLKRSWCEVIPIFAGQDLLESRALTVYYIILILSLGDWSSYYIDAPEPAKDLSHKPCWGHCPTNVLLQRLSFLEAKIKIGGFPGESFYLPCACNIGTYIYLMEATTPNWTIIVWNIEIYRVISSAYMNRKPTTALRAVIWEENWLHHSKRGFTQV